MEREGEEALHAAQVVTLVVTLVTLVLRLFFVRRNALKRWYTRQNYMLLRLLRLISINYAREILLHPCFS